MVVLRTRAANDVDALIKVNRELAQVQSEIKAAEAKKAHLLERVETEILDVRISSDEKRSFWTASRLSTEQLQSRFFTGHCDGDYRQRVYDSMVSFTHILVLGRAQAVALSAYLGDLNTRIEIHHEFLQHSNCFLDMT